MAELHGWLILDKPYGLGSTQAVSVVKRALREGGYAKVKVGHGGTLDPLASGVLPVALGEATKLAGRMLDASKAYDFEITFGVETDTLDAEGSVTRTSDVYPTMAAIKAVLPRFTGLIEQVPPAYSALKIDGERAYDRARAGEPVELASRTVTTHALGIVSYDPDRTTLSAHVSKGTYIRSLARDIAYALGSVGHVTTLRRTRAGPFGLDSAISLDILDEAATGQRLEAYLRPIEAALDGIPALSLTPEQSQALKQGRVLSGYATGDGLYFAKRGDTPVALVEVQDGNVRVERGFNL